MVRVSVHDSGEGMAGSRSLRQLVYPSLDNASQVHPEAGLLGDLDHVPLAARIHHPTNRRSTSAVSEL